MKALQLIVVTIVFLAFTATNVALYLTGQYEGHDNLSFFMVIANIGTALVWWIKVDD